MVGNETDSELLTYKEVSARFKCCPKHLRDKYVKPGLLKTIRRGARFIRFRPSDVEDLIRRLATTGVAGEVS